MRRAWGAALLAVTVAVGVAAQVPTAAAGAAVRAKAKPKAKVPPVRPGRPRAAFFGLHFAPVVDGVSYPRSSGVGSVRLWDTGTTWARVQPARDVWDWSGLDHAVANTRAHGDSVLYVLGQTPLWAAKRVAGVRSTTVGKNYPPDSTADWVTYVTAVATRYQGRIGAYEIWNEMNIGGYYAGSVQDMVRLTRTAAAVIHRVDPAAVVTGPSTTIRGVSGTARQLEFAARGGYTYADVVNVHLYPDVEGTPEDGARMLATFRARLRRAGVTKPIWNTEMNYGLPRAHVPRKKPLTDAQQAAWVIRNYLLQWSFGARRVYWYDWSAASFLGIRMVGTNGETPTQAGESLGLVRRWMNGTVSPCTVAPRTDTYTCRVRYRGSSRGLVVWNPRHRVTVTAPAGTVSATSYRGTVTTGTAAKRLRVGELPVLFTYRMASRP